MSMTASDRGGLPFELGSPVVPAAPAGPMPGEVARGDYWSVIRDGDQYILSFQSGELAGREKQIVIAADEARALAAGTKSAELVLLDHNAG